MNVVELFINTPVNAKLDIDAALPIAIQYQVADIRDISKRNAAYSKTLVLPGTKNNNYWFGNLFDINSDFTMFNPNRKTDAKLLVNGEIVIDGFIQLRKINKETATDFEGNRIQYECVLYNNFVDLMTELGEQTLYELDMSEYNHLFELSSITQSWQHTWQDGYVYPLYGTVDKDYQYNIEYFKPSIFYKAIFNKIVDTAGYGWTGSFQYNEQFNGELIAYVKDGNVFIDETEKNRREWRAGVVNPTIATAGNLTNTAGILVIGNTVVPFNNDTTTPNFDNDNHWSTTLYEWDIDRNGIYDLTYKTEFTANLKNNHAWTVANTVAQPSPPNYQQSLRFTPSVQKWNGSVWQTIYTQTAIGPTSAIQGVGLTLPTTLTAGASYSRFVSFPEITLTNLQLYQNQKIRVVLKSEKVGPPNGPGYSNPVQTPGYYIGLGAGSGQPVSLPLTLTFNTNNSYIFNKAYQNEIVQGDTLDVGVFLPDKIKQKDLISDLIKRYNLYIEVDPDNDRLLVINERPNYYDGQSTIDWTYKKDHSVPEDVQLLSELQFKSMMFTYTSDDDLYNKTYRDITGDDFGQYEYIFDNDFVKGVKEIKSPFSPTPIVKTPFGAFLPAIDPVNPKVKPRILYWSGLRNGANWQMNYQNTNGATISTVFNSYPFAAHWDDPINPTLDINFGGPKYTFYNDWDTLTSNNMYNTYWANYIDEIEDGRLLTANFALDETDIRFIKDNFNTKIFIKDSYYYVNKIIDYNPLINQTTKVELIKINDGIKWIGGNSITQGIYGTVACPNDIISKRIGLAYYYVSQSGAQISQECCNAIGGTYLTQSGACAVKKPITFKPVNVPNNLKKSEFYGSGNDGDGIFFGSGNKTIQVTKTIGEFQRVDRQFIFGDYNTIASDNVVLQGGDNNNVKSTNTVILIGDSNDVEGDTNLLLTSNDNYVEGFDNSLISVNGSTVSGSGITVMNSNGVIASASNIFIVGANTLTATQSDTIYLGNNFTVNSLTGQISIGTQSLLPLKYFTEGSATNSGTASVYIPTTDFIVYNQYDGRSGQGKIFTGVRNATTNNLTEVQQYSTSYYVRAYDDATISDVASFFLQNNNSEGYSSINIVGGTAQTIFNFDPSNNNGGSFMKQQSTVSTEYSEIIYNKNTIQLETLKYDGNSTMLQVVGDKFTFTPDGFTTLVEIAGVPAGYPTGQVLVSGDNLVKYDNQEWTSTGFDQYTHITKGYIDYLGLTSGSTSKLDNVLAVGNTSSLTIELEGLGNSNYPSYTFQSFTQSGIYHSYLHPFISRVGIAAAGATSALFKSDGMAIQDGQVLQGGLHFINDVDTGIFRNTTNQLSIGVGGLTAATFYSGSGRAGIKTPVYSTIVSTNTSVTGTFTQSLIDSNNYAYTLTGNTTFHYSNATQSVYNFLIKAGTYSFTLGSASNWQTVGATALGFTGSFVMSAIFDGTDMWVSTVKNYQSY